MANFTTLSSGLQKLTATPTGDAGLVLNANFNLLNSILTGPATNTTAGAIPYVDASGHIVIDSVVTTDGAGGFTFKTTAFAGGANITDDADKGITVTDGWGQPIINLNSDNYGIDAINNNIYRVSTLSATTVVADISSCTGNPTLDISNCTGNPELDATNMTGSPSFTFINLANGVSFAGDGSNNAIITVTGTGGFQFVGFNGVLFAVDDNSIVTCGIILYTPGDPTKWGGTAPASIQEAINRIAAVVGATIPIP